MSPTNRLTKTVEAMSPQEISDALRDLESRRTAIEWEMTLFQAALEIKRRSEPSTPSAPTVTAHPERRERESLFESANRPDPPRRGKSAIRAVIANDPERTWRIPDVVEAIKRRGWKANEHSVQVALSRMARDGELEKPGVGEYRLPQVDGDPVDETPQRAEP